MELAVNEIMQNLKIIINLLKSAPFDTSTEEGRSKERYRLTILGAMADTVSSGLGLLALIITVPLTLSYLGEERFGVWMTVASLAAMLTFLDLGVGNGFVSHIAKTKAQGNFEEFRCTVTRGLILLLLIGIVVGALLGGINTLLPLETIISVETAQAKEEARILSWVFIVLFSLSIPLNGIYRVYQGLQKSWVVHVLKSAGSILSIIAVVFLSKIEAEPHYLLMATYGIHTLMPIILLIHSAKQRWLTYDFHDDWKNAKLEYQYLLNVGGLFFVLQIGTMIGWGADTLIVSSLAGAAAVAQFVVAQRMYQVVILPMSIINAPLWGAYADAKAHDDKFFILNTLKKSLLNTVAVSSLLSISMFLLSGIILELWIGETIHVQKSLLFGFAVWTVMQSVGNSFAMYLNGMHIIKPQVISVILFCILALPLKIHFVPEYGAEAVIWSTVSTYFISVMLFYMVIFKNDFVKTV